MRKPKRRGRPKLPEANRRSPLGVYLTDEEKRTIEDAVPPMVGTSTWCRLALLQAAERERQRQAEAMIGRV